MATIGPPHLFGDEPQLLHRVLAGVRNYLEFGVGGSTIEAIRAGANTVVSVDSDQDWVAAVRDHPEVAPMVARGDASILHADIGPVGAWGTPAGDAHVRRWPHYIATAWAEWARRDALPDLVFVDGRFRVACCLSAAVMFSGDARCFAPSVLLHDFTDERPGYQDVLEFFEISELVGCLAWLTPRANVGRGRALAALLGRQFDFG